MTTRTRDAAAVAVAIKRVMRGGGCDRGYLGRMRAAVLCGPLRIASVACAARSYSDSEKCECGWNRFCLKARGGQIEDLERAAAPKRRATQVPQAPQVPKPRRTDRNGKTPNRFGSGNWDWLNDSVRALVLTQQTSFALLRFAAGSCCCDRQSAAAAGHAAAEPALPCCAA